RFVYRPVGWMKARSGSSDLWATCANIRYGKDRLTSGIAKVQGLSVDLWSHCCRLALVFMGMVLLTMGCSGSAPSGELQGVGPSVVLPRGFFDDVTASSGVDFTYRNGGEAGHFAILESLGGGVALLDYDQDGLLDIFVSGGGYYAGPDKKEIRGYPN